MIVVNPNEVHVVTGPRPKRLLRIWLTVAMAALASIACQGTSDAPASPVPTASSSVTPVAAPTTAPSRSTTEARPGSTSRREPSLDQRTPFVPLDNPALLTASDAVYLEDDDLVLGLVWEGEARAYPIRMVTFHHIVNDTIAGRPFLVTY